MVLESAIEQRPNPGVPRWPCTGREKGGVGMPTLLTDLVLFSVLAVWVTGIVIAIASLLNCRDSDGGVPLPRVPSAETPPLVAPRRVFAVGSNEPIAAARVRHLADRRGQ